MMVQEIFWKVLLEEEVLWEVCLDESIFIVYAIEDAKSNSLYFWSCFLGTRGLP